MGDRKRSRLLAAMVLVCAWGLGSCSQGPEPVRPGSPAYYRGAAGTAWRAGDYAKTSDSLNQLLNSENEYAARARAWQFVAASGLARGYNNLADAYDSGVRYSRTDPAGFREQVRLARSAASQLSLQAAETFRRFLDTDKNASVAIAFTVPPEQPPAPPLLAKLSKGILLKGAEAEDLQTAMLRQGVAQVAARVTGVNADAAATAPPTEVSREQFLLAAATSLVEQARLFGPKKLDEPQRLIALCGLAQEAIRTLPAGPKVKELQGRIQAVMGKRRAS